MPCTTIWQNCNDLIFSGRQNNFKINLQRSQRTTRKMHEHNIRILKELTKTAFSQNPCNVNKYMGIFKHILSKYIIYCYAYTHNTSKTFYSETHKVNYRILYDSTLPLYHCNLTCFSEHLQRNHMQYKCRLRDHFFFSFLFLFFGKMQHV